MTSDIGAAQLHSLRRLLLLLQAARGSKGLVSFGGSHDSEPLRLYLLRQAAGFSLNFSTWDLLMAVCCLLAGPRGCQDAECHEADQQEEAPAGGYQAPCPAM